jgi:hypothetical protein
MESKEMKTFLTQKPEAVPFMPFIYLLSDSIDGFASM